MDEDQFSNLVQKFRSIKDFDHPDMARIDEIGSSVGADPQDSRRAFFVARDFETLLDVEKLEGGDGSETKKTKPIEILDMTFSKGDSNLENR